MISLLPTLILPFTFGQNKDEVRECSNQLYAIGVMFWAYFLFLTVRTAASMICVIPARKPTTANNYLQLGFACLDGLIVPVCTVWATWVLTTDEVAECRTASNEINDWWIGALILTVVFWIATIILMCVHDCIVLLFCFGALLIAGVGINASMEATARRVGAGAVIDKLKKDTTSWKEVGDKDKTFEECVICMSKFEDTDQVSSLQCDSRHVFHTECLSQWMQTKTQCPLCKVEIPK